MTTARLAISLDSDLAQEVRRLSRKRKRTISGVVADALEAYLRNDAGRRAIAASRVDLAIPIFSDEELDEERRLMKELLKLPEGSIVRKNGKVDRPRR